MGIFDMITGNLGSFANIISGGQWNPFGQSTLQQQQAFAVNQASGAYLPQYAANMRAAGFNPYGGGMSPPGVSMPGGGGDSPLGGALGGVLNRALSAGSAPESKQDQLQNQLLESQITHSDLLNAQLASSITGRSAGSADLPFYGGTGRGVPLPARRPAELMQLDREAWSRDHPNMWTAFYDNPTPNDTRFTVGISPEYQRSLFSGVPSAPLYPGIAAALAGKNLAIAGQSYWDDLKAMIKAAGGGE